MTLAIGEWAVTGLLGLMATMLWRQLKQLKTDADKRGERSRIEFDAVKRGLQLQMRSNLVELHDRWIVDKGYMPIEVKSLFFDMYKAYEALGANGVITTLYDDVRQAHVAPDNETDKQEGERT